MKKQILIVYNSRNTGILAKNIGQLKISINKRSMSSKENAATVFYWKLNVIISAILFKNSHFALKIKEKEDIPP